MTAILRTRTIDESAGFMKVLVEKAGDRILGFTMIGPEAGKSWPPCRRRCSGACLLYAVLRDAILTHPTMAEGLGSLFAAGTRSSNRSTFIFSCVGILIVEAM